MLNYIWFALMAIALVVAIFTGSAPAVTRGAVDSARTAVEIALGLIGIMTLWLGIMRVAEKAGLIALLGRILRPISRVLFPEVPPDHPAIGSMIMNVAANLLGLSNAATPFGIKAMEELQTLNTGDKETASNAMVTFMTLNTAGIQFIPATMIGVLAATGSRNPTAIIAPTFISTLCGAIVAVTMSKVLQRFSPSPTGRGWPEGPGEGREATESMQRVSENTSPEVPQ
jgi:spore maturation protein A